MKKNSPHTHTHCLEARTQCTPCTMHISMYDFPRIRNETVAWYFFAAATSFIIVVDVCCSAAVVIEFGRKLLLNDFHFLFVTNRNFSFIFDFNHKFACQCASQFQMNDTFVHLHSFLMRTNFIAYFHIEKSKTNHWTSVQGRNNS